MLKHFKLTHKSAVRCFFLEKNEETLFSIFLHLKLWTFSKSLAVNSTIKVSIIFLKALKHFLFLFKYLSKIYYLRIANHLQIEISKPNTSRSRSTSKSTLNYIDLNLPSKTFLLWINCKNIKISIKEVFTILQNNFYCSFCLSMRNLSYFSVSYFPVYRLYFF